MQNKTPIPSSNVEPDPRHAPLGKKKATRLDSPVNMHIHSRRYRLADPDGLSAKAVIDGLVLGGLLEDDSPEFVKKVTFSQEKIKKPLLEETIITITDIEEV